MSNNKFESDDFFEETSIDDDFLFSNELKDIYPANKRTAVRYLRDDIKISLKATGFFKWRRVPEIKLIDISSKGVYISCTTNLKLKKAIILIFTFKDGKQFQIDGRVIHRFPKTSNCYGIKFNKYNHDLGDYLLETQDELNFK